MSRDIINISLNHLLISNKNDINFFDILKDYRKSFAGHRIKITTNFNLLSEFDIVFSEKDIPHLMGWNKIRANGNATKIIRDIESGEWNKKIAKKNPNWIQSQQRMLNYNIMHRIFLDKDLIPMVITSDMKPNRLKLDIVFVSNIKNESIILGFRKDKTRNFFVPTTLHVEKKMNQYNKRRRTLVKTLDWVD